MKLHLTHLNVIKKIFAHIDKKGTGYIKEQEFQELIALEAIHFPDDFISFLIDQIKEKISQTDTIEYLSY